MKQAMMWWLIFHLTLGSLQGTVSYGLCRFLEQRCRWLMTALIWLVTPILSIASFFLGVPLIGIFFIFLPLGVLGGWLHSRSMPVAFKSRAIFVSSVALLLNIPLYFPSLEFINHFKLPVPSRFGPGPGIFTLVFPAIAPLLWWIVNGLRIRPGIDEPFTVEGQA